MALENGKQKKNNGILLVCVILFAVCTMAVLFLMFIRKNLIEDYKSELLAETEESAATISETIETRFDMLETIQDIVSQTYDIGPEAALYLENSRVKYGISYLGLIDKEYTYFGSTGKIVKNVEAFDANYSIAGEKRLMRDSDAGSLEGIAFMLPYSRNGEITGVICSKYVLQDFASSIGREVTDAAEIVVDINGSIVLESATFEEYMRGESWKELSDRGMQWKNKERFERQMYGNGAAVASGKGKDGKSIYFAAAKVGAYEDFYVVRFVNSTEMEDRVQASMKWLYFFLALMVVFGICFLIMVIYNRRKNQKEVYKAAYVDTLTGLPSKVKHKLDAQGLIDKRDRKYAYISFDVDNFKYINEMFGYDYGNRILRRVADAVKEHTGERELCSRVSADNFALLWTDCEKQEELEERISALFASITNCKDDEKNARVCTLKFSCGVFRIEEPMDINAVRANANLARTESKKRLFNQIVFYDDTLKARRVEERELEYDAEEALKNGEFEVYCQPKFDVDSEQIIGAEALVRWKHSKRGMLSPGVFIPLFEANGFVIELDMYVLNKVCELIAKWLEAGLEPLCVSVNLSRTHLYEQDLVQKLVDTVEKYNIPPEYIEFELTESAFYEQMETLLRIMEEIKQAGFRLSMDDFGSGYSSLNLLRQLPVDVLKLDRGFLDECDTGEIAGNSFRGRRIVTHVISMAKDLEMSVLAEGVETKKQKEFLQQARCDMIQGYYYAKPMPIPEFEERYIKKKL